MELHTKIDNKIQEGYTYMLKNQTTKGCDLWLEAWEDIKPLFKLTGAKDVYELNKKYTWTQFISNYVQDLEMELHNAGIRDAAYHQKRITYCQELLSFCGDDELINSNTRQAIGEAYFELGDRAACDRFFEGWLQEEPGCSRAYIGWANCYSRFKPIAGDYDKAEQILLHGLNQVELSNKVDLVYCLVLVYEQIGKQEKVKEYKKLFRELLPTASKNSIHYRQQPAKSIKIGRNEPCSCGSNKKYKKCCGMPMTHIGA